MLEMCECRARHAILTKFEGDTWQEDAVKKALQNGRNAKAPDGKDKDQRLSRQKPRHIGFHWRAIGGDFMIAKPLSAAQDGVETLSIKIEMINNVAGML